MGGSRTFYVLVHLEDLQYVDKTGYSFTKYVLAAMKFYELNEAIEYRKIFDFPDEFGIYEVELSYTLKRMEEKEND